MRRAIDRVGLLESKDKKGGEILKITIYKGS